MPRPGCKRWLRFWKTRTARSLSPITTYSLHKLSWRKTKRLRRRLLEHARSLLTDSNQHGFDNYNLTILETRAANAVRPGDNRTRDDSLLQKLNVLASHCANKGLIGLQLAGSV